ncbi:10434_t:CDS:2, partial [Acaulospora colombiana]
SLLRRGLASKTIYVANVSFNSTEQGLEELGSKFGKVESVRMPRDYEGRSRGYGFIEYSQEEEAAKAMDGLNVSRSNMSKLLSATGGGSDNRIADDLLGKR